MGRKEREGQEEEDERTLKLKSHRNIVGSAVRGVGHLMPRGIKNLDDIVDPRMRHLYGAKLDTNKLFGIRKDAALIRPDTPLYKKKKGKNPYKGSMARMRRLLR